MAQDLVVHERAHGRFAVLRRSRPLPTDRPCWIVRVNLHPLEDSYTRVSSKKAGVEAIDRVIKSIKEGI